MMGAHRKTVEFDAILDESGRIAIPASTAKELGSSPGTIHVRLTSKAISSELKARNVSEEEIERISSIQLESRDQVVKFLLSEGALMKRGGQKMMKR